MGQIHFVDNFVIGKWPKFDFLSPDTCLVYQQYLFQIFVFFTMPYWTITNESLWGVYSVSGKYFVGVWKVSGMCLKAAWKCLNSFWWMPGGLSTPNGIQQNTFCHEIFFEHISWNINFFTPNFSLIELVWSNIFSNPHDA